MSKSNTLEGHLIAKIFNNTAIPWDAITTLYISLHTADPGEAGNQGTSEAAYTSYARVAISRDSAGFTVAGATASNTSLFQFPQCTGGSASVTHIGVGTSLSGAGTLLYSGALSAPLNISTGIQPQFAAGLLTVNED